MKMGDLSISNNIKIKIVAIIVAILSWFYVPYCYAENGDEKESHVMQTTQLDEYFTKEGYPVTVTYTDEEFLFAALRSLGVFKISITDLNRCEYLATKNMYDLGQSNMKYKLQVNAAFNNFKVVDIAESLKDQIIRFICVFSSHKNHGFSGSYLVRDEDVRWENLGGYWIPLDEEVFALYANGDYLYVGTKKGVFRVNHKDKDPDARLTSLGLEPMPVYALTFFDDYLYVGTKKGIFRKDISDVNSEWDSIMEGHGVIKNLLVSSNYLYAAGQEGVFRINLVDIESGWEDLGIGKGMYALYEYKGYLYASDGEEIFCMSLTDENGSSWQQVRNLYDSYTIGFNIGVPALANLIATIAITTAVFKGISYVSNNWLAILVGLFEASGGFVVEFLEDLEDLG